MLYDDKEFGILEIENHRIPKSIHVTISGKQEYIDTCLLLKAALHSPRTSIKKCKNGEFKFDNVKIPQLWTEIFVGILFSVGTRREAICKVSTC